MRLLVILLSISILTLCFQSCEEEETSITVTHFRIEDGLPFPEIYDICEDQDGNIWISARGKLAILKDGNITQMFGELSEISKILPDPSGNL